MCGRLEHETDAGSTYRGLQKKIENSSKALCFLALSSNRQESSPLVLGKTARTVERERGLNIEYGWREKKLLPDAKDEWH
jgi:hypothetical protein